MITKEKPILRWRVERVDMDAGGDAKHIWLKPQHGTENAVRWQAGQHLTFMFEVDGTPVRRSYSISVPSGELARISVKRVLKGAVSNALVDGAKVGDILRSSPPSGRFAVEASSDRRRTHYFFAAGSGITPVVAMIMEILQEEKDSTCHLVYGNRNAQSIMFRDEIEQLVASSDGRLTVRHCLSRPSFFSSFAYWRRARVSASMLSALFEEAPPIAQDTQFWICGPADMISELTTGLRQHDVAENRIHLESFTGVMLAPKSSESTAAKVVLRLASSTYEYAMPANKTILSGAREAGIEAPFSCQSGVCGECRAKLKQGSTYMPFHPALTEKEVLQGDILTCQAIATSKELLVSYDI